MSDTQRFTGISYALAVGWCSLGVQAGIMLGVQRELAMPCNCDHLEASSTEIELSRVLALLDELKSGKAPSQNDWDGYHAGAYNKASKTALGARTADLCQRLQTFSRTRLSRYSLELQTWWRDHQKADKARVEAEVQEGKIKLARKRALAKLTPYERGLLGV